jgi:hypothetical protein
MVTNFLSFLLRTYFFTFWILFGLQCQKVFICFSNLKYIPGSFRDTLISNLFLLEIILALIFCVSVLIFFLMEYRYRSSILNTVPLAGSF